MTMNLLEENLLNIKIKEEEIPEQQTTNIRSSVSYNMNNNNNSINDILISMINKNISNNNNLLQDKYIPKLPEYKFDIENLYEDQNYEYEKSIKMTKQEVKDEMKIEDIPDKFITYYNTLYVPGKINKNELSNLSSLSYPTTLKYISILENNK